MVIKSDVLGFCSGVRRAVSLAKEALKSGPVYCIGSLIHNERVLESLSGLVTVRFVSEVPPGAVVIIRAHGVERSTFDSLVARGCSIIDATCPRVKRSQELVARYSGEGYNILFCGDKGHAEVKSVESYCTTTFTLLSGVGSGEDTPPVATKSALLSQTTFSKEKFLFIAEALKNNFSANVLNTPLVIEDTICGATAKRQEALLTLCKKVDAVVVVGSNKSSNTRRLFKIAKEHSKAFLVSSRAEIPPLIGSVVGVTAGASTPDDLINEVISALNERL